MHVDDEIAHMGVVDGLLRLCLPRGIGGSVVGINADDVELVEIPELNLVQIRKLATEDEVEQLPVSILIRHVPRPPERARA